MKRSTAITLLGAGVAAWAGINYFSDDTVSAAAYENVGQCSADGRSREACERAFAQASDEHQKAAPHYARREDCEAEFGSGACTTLPGAPGSATGSFFVPAMAGFLLANAFYSTYPAQPLYRPCSDPSDPRCRGSSFTGGGGGSAGGSGGRGFFTSTGERVSTSAGRTEVGRSAFTGHGSAATLARGGFGARAASFGGGRG